MYWIGRIIIACSLISLTVGCDKGEGQTTERPAAKSEPAAAPGGANAATAPGGPTCDQQVGELSQYLAALDKARTALAADPLAVRKGAVLTAANAVSLTHASLITPVPKGITVEVGKDNVYIAGKMFAPTAKITRVIENALSKHLGTAICPDSDKAALQDIIVVAHPDAPWAAVQRIIHFADDAGAARVLLAFGTPAVTPAPTQAELAAVAHLDEATAFPLCPGLAQALRGSGLAAESTSQRNSAITSALKSCQCAVSPMTVRTLVYGKSDLAERGNQIPAAVALSFVDPQAKPEAQRTVIAAAKNAPWSQAHGAVIAARETGSAFVAGLQGTKLSKNLLAVPGARTAGQCVAKLKRAERNYRGVRFEGELEKMKGSAFASLTGTGDFSSGLDDANVMGGLLGDEVGEMEGGFGFGKAGFGPGGGGTGWGTIGTGNYGTIGHGSGTSSPYGSGSGKGKGKGKGGMRGRKASPPQVRIGNAVVVGSLDKNIVRRYIRRKLPRIKYCYEKQLLVKPGIAGTVNAKFQISPQGMVKNSKAGGVHRKVADCVAGVIKTIKFPKPKEGDTVRVRYPFTFKPTGG